MLVYHGIQQHPDGKWYTSEDEYEGHKLQIKMSTTGMSGCKIHIWDKNGDKVVKTLRYNFAKPAYLLTKAQNWINQNNINE